MPDDRRDDSRLIVVLHRSVYSRNIGMCARALANMGGARLILIAPQNLLTDEVKQGAAHAQKILREAVTYPSLTEFYAQEGDGIRIALSGRAGVKEPQSLDQLASSWTSDTNHRIHDRRVPVYLHFGPEDDGLSDEEMRLVHHVARLPTFGEITSLNLSHAVLLACYIIRSQIDLASDDVVQAPLFHPSATIHTWLEKLGFDLSAPKANIEKTLNRILLSHCPSPEELRIIENVLQQTIRKLK